MKWFEKTPKVILEMYDGRLVIVKAYKNQSGWIARWIENRDTWSTLLPDGTTGGTNLVKSWKPYSNCPKEMTN